MRQLFVVVFLFLASSCSNKGEDTRTPSEASQKAGTLEEPIEGVDILQEIPLLEILKKSEHIKHKKQVVMSGEDHSFDLDTRDWAVSGEEFEYNNKTEQRFKYTVKESTPVPEKLRTNIIKSFTDSFVRIFSKDYCERYQAFYENVSDHYDYIVEVGKNAYPLGNSDGSCEFLSVELDSVYEVIKALGEKTEIKLSGKVDALRKKNDGTQKIRIISARQACRKEKNFYQKEG